MINLELIITTHLILAVFLSAPVFADTLYFPNGSSVEGIITKEDQNSVVLNVGFGTVVFDKKEIKRIEKSGESEISQIYKRWEEQRQKLQEERFKSSTKTPASTAGKSYKPLPQQPVQRSLTSEPKVACKTSSVNYFQDNRNILVDVYLAEGSRRALGKFIVDTGASISLMSQDIAEKLGISTDVDKKDQIEVVMADGRKAKAKYVSLDLVQVGDTHLRKVAAVVLLDEQRMGTKMADGLLGMSFLKHFYFLIDPNSSKLVLIERK